MVAKNFVSIVAQLLNLQNIQVHDLFSEKPLTVLHPYENPERSQEKSINPIFVVPEVILKPITKLQVMKNIFKRKSSSTVVIYI